MKYAIVIPDGAADHPSEALSGQTPFEVARIPNMDRVASEGRLGRVSYVPEGLPAGSDVCILGLLGYDGRKCYTGRAPLEAAAADIPVGDDDWVFRMNLVTVTEDEMDDYSAGHITSKEARVLVEALEAELGTADLEFHPGVGYRHLLLVRGGEFDVETTPPHDILGQPVRKHLPKGDGADRLRELMDASRRVLADHPVNQVRRDLGEHPATQIWLWGEGTRPNLEPFERRWGLTGAAITAVDLVRGISKLIGWDLIEVEGATGYYDTNYEGKGRAAVDALATHDLVLVHVEATDEAGHNGDALEKVRALEQIDQHVVGPLLEALEAAGEPFRLLVSPDHPTPVEVRTHERGDVPLAIIGAGIESPRSGAHLTESEARERGFPFEIGHKLMEYFLKR